MLIRRALVPVLLAFAGLCALPAADKTAIDAPPGAGVSAITATVEVPRANVRFGPGQTAKVACTLNKGDTVEIIGTAQVPDWYVVRFPTQGRAWVSVKVLSPVDGGKRWKVTVDGAHARADATIGAEIVCDMAMGEVLEDRGQVQGDFHAVYIPSAVAYIKKELLTLPDASAVTQQVQHGSEIQQLWDHASAEYIRDYNQVQADPKAAATIAWDPLLQDLDRVANESADPLVAQKARRCHDGIQRVIDAGKATPALPPVASDPPAKPNPAPLPAPGQTVAANNPSPAQTPDNPADYHVPAGQPGAAPNLLAVPEAAPPSPDEVAKPVAPAAAPAGPPVAEGYVIANSDYPKVNAPFLLQDGNSKTVAFLAPKDGSGIVLGDYNWRSVGVDGDKSALDAAALAASKLPDGIPLITVTRVSILNK
jgi:uncharacterized protein YgiM (DUF1202 family)